MASSTVAAVLAALRTALETRVQADADFGAAFPVLLVAEGGTALEEAIVLIRPADPGTALSQKWAHIGGTQRDETFTVPGALWVKAAGKNDGASTVFQAAMDRATDLLDHVIHEIRDNPPAVGVQTLDMLVTDTTWRPGRIDQGWEVTVEFAIKATVRVT